MADEFSTDAVDVILTLRNLNRFLAGTKAAASGVRGIGAAAKESDVLLSASARRMNGVAALAAKAWKGSAAALALAAVTGTRWSVKFNQQMELAHTQAGASQQAVDSFTKSILNLSGNKTAQGPTDLAKGFYHLVSLGVPLNKIMGALTVAAEGADIGLANMEDTTSALGAVWFTNIKGAGGFHNIMAALNATVGAGNMRMQELVDSLGTGILPAAKLAGIGLHDVLGAVAVLADMKYNPTSALTQMATALHFITDPSLKAAKALKEIGLGKKELSKVMHTQGLPATLSVLRAHLSAHAGGIGTVKAGSILGDIFPAGRGRVLQVLLEQLDRYNQKIKQIYGTQNTFGEKLAATHRTAGYQIRLAWARAQVALIKFGDIFRDMFAKVAGVASRVLGVILTVVGGIIKLAFGLDHLKGPVGFIVHYLVTFALIVAGLAALVWVWGAIAAGLQLIFFWFVGLNALTKTQIWILAIAAVAALAILIIQHWKKLGPFFAEIWNEIKHIFNQAIGAIVGAAKAFWNAIQWYFFHLTPIGIIIANFDRIKNFIVGAWNTIVNFIKKLPGRIAAAAVGLWDGFKSGLISVLNWISDKINRYLIHPLNDVITVGGLLDFGQSIPDIPRLAQGGKITGAGWAMVGENGPELLRMPRGAEVQPLTGHKQVGVTPMQLPEHITIVQIDRRELARAVGKYQDDRDARS